MAASDAQLKKLVKQCMKDTGGADKYDELIEYMLNYENPLANKEVKHLFSDWHPINFDGG